MAERVTASVSSQPQTRRDFLCTAGFVTVTGGVAAFLLAKYGIDLGYHSQPADVESYYEIQFRDVDFYAGIPGSKYQTSIEFISPRTGNAGSLTTASIRSLPEGNQYEMGLGELGMNPRIYEYRSKDELKDALVDRWLELARTEGNVKVRTEAAVMLSDEEIEQVLSALDTTPIDGMVSWEYWDIAAYVVSYGEISKGQSTRRSYIYVQLSEKIDPGTAQSDPDVLSIIVEPNMVYNLGRLADSDEVRELAGGEGFSLRNRDRIRDEDAKTTLHSLVEKYTPN